MANHHQVHPFSSGWMGTSSSQKREYHRKVGRVVSHDTWEQTDQDKVERLSSITKGVANRKTRQNNGGRPRNAEPVTLR
ncbi:hypothetical protein CHS0354_024865 [Potamilus streckersoni]|uniref:Uncharacterized protein n=1 Tax=Potamilus streckersoni TaxID=2493646 RepID=A0AAE0W0Y4_9BIVA|nr:hypothetical protein CHS0354_024865 [Potamilus streckersoni]